MKRLLLATLAFATLAFGSTAYAQDQPPVDEPGRPVARLSLINGDASVRRGDSGDWVAASVNAPLMVEDSVSVGPGGYAEIQFDSANYVRVAGDSEARISTLEDGRYGVQILKGMVTFRTLRQTSALAEVATPQVAVRPGQNSSIRVELLADGYSRVEVRAGEAEIFTPHGVEKVHAGSMMMLRGTSTDPEFQVSAATPQDEWDSFNQRRDQDLLASKAYQYVSRDINGAEDLDRSGRWVNDPQYGNVWAPTVAADWAPYRSGRWVWEDYYGWTWVGNESWGWAPYHYGNWYYRGGGFGWCWFPGGGGRHFWRPALVGFVGFGGGFGSGVGWVPLAPYETFHPWYGRGWYGGRSTVVNNINIVNNTNINNVYRNARVGGVSGVGANEFNNGRFNSVRGVGNRELQSASISRGALPMQPNQTHLGFTARPVSTAGPRINVGQSRGFGGSTTPTVSERTPFTRQQSAFSGAGSAGAAGMGRPAPFAGPAAASGNRNGSGAQGWQRFGSPQNSVGSVNESRPSPQTQSRPTQQGQAWNSFGRPGATPQTAPPNSRPSQPNYNQAAPQSNFRQAPQQSNFNSGREVRVAPPMVQQREQQQRSQPQQYSAPTQRQYSAPQPRQYSAPPERQFSAPQQRQYSAPAPQQRQYSAPQQRQYSAPAPQQRQYSAPQSQSRQSAPQRAPQSAPSRQSGGGQQSGNSGRR